MQTLSLIKMQRSPSRVAAWLGLLAVILLFIAPVISKSLVASPAWHTMMMPGMAMDAAGMMAEPQHGAISDDVTAEHQHGAMAADITAEYSHGAMAADITAEHPHNAMAANITPEHPHGARAADITAEHPRNAMADDVTAGHQHGTVSNNATAGHQRSTILSADRSQPDNDASATAADKAQPAALSAGHHPLAMMDDSACGYCVLLAHLPLDLTRLPPLWSSLQAARLPALPLFSPVVARFVPRFFHPRAPPLR